MQRSPGVSVQHLRARWASREPGVDDRPARQVWLSMLLGGCDLTPPGMPPSAILVVRRLADPLPGRVARSPHAIRTEPEWEQAMRSTLADLWRRAARPEGGRVDEQAEAVLFADQAEQTACLALDLAAGETSGRRWWGGAVFAAEAGRMSAGAGQLYRVLGGQPELLPAVFSYLAAWAQVEQVAAALAPAESLSLALAMAAALGVPDWRKPGVASDSGRPAWDAPSPQIPWPEAVMLQVVGLGREQATLVGLGLTLERWPGLARSAGFGRSLSAWRAAAGPAGPGARPGAEGQRAQVPVGLAPPEHGAPRPEAGGTGAPGPGGPGLRAGAPPLSSFATPALPDAGAEGEVGTIATPDHHPAPADALKPPPAPGDQSDAHQTTAPDSEAVAPGLSKDPWPCPAPFPLEGIATRLGGLFYLVNLMLRLGLPEAYTDDLGPWACLEALGRALLPACDEWSDLAEDPVWAALAELDGREPRTLQGEGLDLSVWLPRALAEIHEWLAQALLVDDPVLHLLLVPARLHITATHVDLTIDIERISLAVRMAGLDQDPGWQPAFCRVIQFHFN